MSRNENPLQAVISSGVVAGLCWWGLQHTGPVMDMGELNYISAFLWYLLLISLLRFAAKLLMLPFSNHDKGKR